MKKIDVEEKKGKSEEIYLVD